MSVIERVWFGSSAVAGVARAALWPLATAFGAVTTARRALYSAGLLPTREAVLPCVSVGNLTVGGTGKTPFAAWLAGLLSANAKVAIVLRGYGGDEAEVHRRLNPGLPVVALADRVVAVHMAKAANAQVAVLDDAFQHRRISRIADIVLVSVEQLLRPRRLLPAGPWREGLSAARTADLIVLTRKSATIDDANAARKIVATELPSMPIAVVLLASKSLERVNGAGSRPLGALRNAAVLAVAAIGEPDLFRNQLTSFGARVTLASFRDHHAFSAEEVRRLAESEPDALAVCTMKDAVKLARLWPASRELWYLSQQLVVEQGAEHIERLCARVLERVSPAIAG
ncbi:MAG: tetraacyldisaccharide 4'-kinase [Gemmatimonadota bacterium]